MPQNNQYLIISQSGRALAASAKRAGIDTHVIDLFADEDTAENTLSNTSVTGFSGGNNAETLIELVAEYANNNPALCVVIGSGFEECPDR
jgi:predicted ATP-grasp superfamily ATP-dependent carboligase